MSYYLPGGQIYGIFVDEDVVHKNENNVLTITAASSAQITSAVAAEAIARTAAIGVETTARTAADAVVATSVTAEATARAAADTAEVTNRNTAISAAVATEVTNRNTAIGVETTNRTTADALLLPKAGTATNDNATAGQVGEFKSTDVLAGSAVSLTSGAVSDVATLSLTAGDWNVWGVVRYTPGASTMVAVAAAWASQTSATAPTTSNGGGITVTVGNTPAGLTPAVSAGYQRISLAATTTIYLSTYTTFSVSTLTAWGFIGARRAR